MSNASLIYSTCKQLKGTVLAEGIWFANQICPYMFECFHDPLTKPGKGTAGRVCLIITTAALTGTVPQDLKSCPVSRLLEVFHSATTGSAADNSIFTGAML